MDFWNNILFNILFTIFNILIAIKSRENYIIKKSIYFNSFFHFIILNINLLYIFTLIYLLIIILIFFEITSIEIYI